MNLGDRWAKNGRVRQFHKRWASRHQWTENEIAIIYKTGRNRKANIHGHGKRGFGLAFLEAYEVPGTKPKHAR